MIRFLNVIAFLSLIFSAAYAYSVKYETLAHHEEVKRLNNAIQNERKTIGELKAKWAFLIHPERLQKIVDQVLPMKQLDVRQLARFYDLPERPLNRDQLGKQLEKLGLGSILAPQSGTEDFSSGRRDINDVQNSKPREPMDILNGE